MIKAIIIDVDGTLTDGKLHISSHGELFKSFDVKDGYAIRTILSQHKIAPIVITGRTSQIVEERCKELHILYLYQGVTDKAACLKMIAVELGLSFNQIACIGDDENDLPMMRLCGVKGCPADAVTHVKQVSDFVCSRCGGNGAVREFIDWLVKNET